MLDIITSPSGDANEAVLELLIVSEEFSEAACALGPDVMKASTDELKQLLTHIGRLQKAATTCSKAIMTSMAGC